MGASARTAAPKPEPILKGQTPNQKGYIRKLTQKTHDILISVGPAGTGKTYVAVLYAIQQFRAGEIDKIIITRPMVGSSGEELGILPGGVTEKVAPWCIPILDIFKEFYSKYEVENMIDREIIEIAPLAIMRGRTFKHALIIADEAQNTTPEQMKMLLTRVGEGSRMIITGDVEQTDRRQLGGARDADGIGISGLADVMDRLKARDARLALSRSMQTDAGNYDGRPPAHRPERIGIVTLTRADVVRHPVVEDVLALYDEDA